MEDLFKYRSLFTDSDLQRTLDIIYMNRIYNPSLSQLNDKREALMLHPFASTWNRTAMVINRLLELRSKYHVVSFSSSPEIDPQWAHYGSQGVCLRFSPVGYLRQAEPVSYLDNPLVFSFDPDAHSIDALVYTSLLFKHSDWRPEAEYRIITRDTPDFLSLPEGALTEVIISHEAPTIYVQYIQQACAFRHVPCCFAGRSYPFNELHFSAPFTPLPMLVPPLPSSKAASQ